MLHRKASTYKTPLLQWNATLARSIMPVINDGIERTYTHWLHEKQSFAHNAGAHWFQASHNALCSKIYCRPLAPNTHVQFNWCAHNYVLQFQKVQHSLCDPYLFLYNVLLRQVKKISNGPSWTHTWFHIDLNSRHARPKEGWHTGTLYWEVQIIVSYYVLQYWLIDGYHFLK